MQVRVPRALLCTCDVCHSAAVVIIADNTCYALSICLSVCLSPCLSVCDPPPIQAEDAGAGGITLQTYANYARAGGGVLVFVAILLVFFAAMFARAFGDFYLGYWIRQVC